MSLPPNFANAVDLSSLGKPKIESDTPLPGIEVTAQNLSTEFLPASRVKPVVLLCYSLRDAGSVETLQALGNLEAADQGKWILGRVDVDTQAPVAQALQTRVIPYGVVFIGERPIPFLEQPLGEEGLRTVIDKILALASQDGIGEAPEEASEPEEEEALAALDQGDYALAADAYKRLLARKPNDHYGVIGLAQVQLLIRTEGVDAVKVMDDALKNPSDLELGLMCADVEVMSGYLEPAFERLIKFIQLLDGDDRQRVKERLLELFGLVDPADPRVIKARAQLANALF